jgi:hypothetical protein
MPEKAPGTVYGRFDYFLRELEMRYDTNRFSARPPEILFLEEMDKEHLQLLALREAMQAAIIALDDWTNIYAEEFCDPARVEEAKQRVHENGLLHYLATVVQQCRTALKEDNGNQDQDANR